MRDIPEDIIQALDTGELDTHQLRWLIHAEAEHLGLTLDESIKANETRSLPACRIGSDLTFLLDMWLTCTDRPPVP